MNKRRGAALYLAVTGVAMVIATIALATSEIGRAQLRDNRRRLHAIEARFAARSGVEQALVWLNENPNWRSTLTNNVDGDTHDLVNGRYVWRVIDDDGDLADDARDHATLRVTGFGGTTIEAYHVVEVDIEPAGRALTCLESAVHAATNLTIGSGATLNGSGVASANLDIDATSANVELDARAGGNVNGGVYHGEAVDGDLALETPSEHVFDWYVQNGTEIGLENFDDVFGVKVMTDNRLGRAFADHGLLNRRGIYWIDCEGNSLQMTYSRLHGTLVILNPGPATAVSGVVLFQTEAQNRPVLLVDGDLLVDLRESDGATGQELTEVGFANFNPSGMPYGGSTDNDQLDTYPARLDGILYASGTIRFTDDAVVHGCVVANEVVVDGGKSVTVEYRPYHFNYPPPGFSAGAGARILPNSWRHASR